MPQSSKRRVQFYAALLAALLFLMTYSLARTAADALDRGGLAAGWVPLLGAIVAFVCGIALVVYALRLAPLRPKR